MNTKLLGGILLVVGTSLGGGMLALPVTAAPAGFVNSIFLLFFCWFFMTFSAFLILEVNLWLPANSNIVSMAKLTLGPIGQIAAWLTYLLLLYSLIAAYISAGTDVLHSLLGLLGFYTSNWLASILFVSLFSLIVYKGIRSVDYVNRGFMVTKLAAYVVLVALIAPHLNFSQLTFGELRYLPQTIMVMITSFGFATLVPSLRAYFGEDIKKLRLAIFIGSLIPLIAYIVWIGVILSVLPHEGKNGLIHMITSGHATTDLINALSNVLQNPSVNFFTRLFTSVAVITSFLGVSLGLSDFLADGFGVSKKGKGAFLVYPATFLPSLAIVLFYPNAFILGLTYAGTFCIILLAFLPMLMVWRGRYHKNLSTTASYRIKGGKPTLLLGMVISVIITIYTLVMGIH
jgi:tyrosine-specific transport protein